MESVWRQFYHMQKIRCKENRENEKISIKKDILKECCTEGWVKRYAEEMASFSRNISFHNVYILWFQKMDQKYNILLLNQRIEKLEFFSIAYVLCILAEFHNKVSYASLAS
jgi:hypothetical protein